MAKAAHIVTSLIRTWCVIALVMVGFAHTPVVAAPFGPIEMAAYVLPDGTVPIFCINDVSDSKSPVKTVSYGCDACRLAAAVLLPVPAAVAERIIHAEPADIAVAREIVLVQRLYPPNARPRAPPATVMST